MNTEALFDYINTHIFGITVPLLLISAGIYFSFKLRCFHFLHPINSLKKMLKKEEGESSSESPVHALCMALAGTLGVGNISGIALAIGFGGAGAIFWMWMSAFAAMIIRYAEIVLALDFRTYKNGEYTGSAMNYIKKSYGRAGKILAPVFAVLCIICSLFLGGIIQANVISECFFEIMGYPKIISGTVLCIATMLVVFGGAKKISSLTVKIVPVMTILYIFISLFVICSQAEHIPEVITTIFKDAFSVKSAGGGVLGILLSPALRTGVSRGLISNEAGCGTAPMAHARSTASAPSKQGLFGIFEVFVDTILLCTLTAFVILLSFESIPTVSGGGIMLVIEAFAHTFGKNAGFLISVSIFFFAFATIVCWAFYGENCIRYFVNDSKKVKVFLFIFSVSLIYGSIAMPSLIWSVTDFIISAMTVINIGAVILMADRVKTLSAKYGLLDFKIKEHEYARKGVPLKNKVS
ncbi:MAG: alanine:cation symporter family protein [Ruminococcaceae bacterium]|nr:alanine:cation symporter family protein [Oscillospiraceae bacterium]